MVSRKIWREGRSSVQIQYTRGSAVFVPGDLEFRANTIYEGHCCICSRRSWVPDAKPQLFLQLHNRNSQASNCVWFNLTRSGTCWHPEQFYSDLGGECRKEKITSPYSLATRRQATFRLQLTNDRQAAVYGEQGTDLPAIWHLPKTAF
jgi:hypothetical protein